MSGRRGPARTPAPILEMRGSPRAKRDKNAPKAPATSPRMPAWLDAVGKTRWKQMLECLKDLRILSHVDAAAIAIHCETYSQYRACIKEVRKSGSFYIIKTAKNGALRKERPESLKATKLLPLLRAQMSEFGLTPSARSSIELPTGSSGDSGGGLEQYQS